MQPISHNFASFEQLPLLVRETCLNRLLTSAKESEKYFQTNNENHKSLHMFLS